MVVQVTRLLATEVGREHTKRYDCLLFSPPFKRAIGRLGHCPDSDPTEGPTEGPTESARVSIPGRAANSPPSGASGDWRDPADEKRHRARNHWSALVISSRQGGPKSG